MVSGGDGEQSAAAILWRVDVDRAAGTMTVPMVDTPTQVTLWQSSNEKARDFRLETIGPAWTRTPVSRASGGTR